MTDVVQNLVEEILSSYEARVKEVSALVEEGGLALEAFNQERRELFAHLRETLAKRSSLRRKDFQLMTAGIQNHQVEREFEVREALGEFQREERERFTTLRRLFFNESNSLNPENLEQLRVEMDNIQVRQKEREEGLKQRLDSFQKEREVIKNRLTGLLARGESLKIKDFKRTIKKIQPKNRELIEVDRLIAREREKLKDEVGQMLSEIRKEQQNLSKEWQRLKELIPKVRG